MPDTPVAVVTGANSGIGRATAIAFAQAGYRVFGTVRGLAKADKLLAKARDIGVADRLQLIEMDVADSDSVTRGFGEIFAATDRVDVLVNNAGVGGNAVTEECPIDTYNTVFNINHNGSVRCIQAVLPGMRARRSGAIVNVSSVVGKITAIAQSPYYVSKWAVEGMSEGLAQELAPFGIRVAIVEPGVTRSSIFGKNIDAPNQTAPTTRTTDDCSRSMPRASRRRLRRKRPQRPSSKPRPLRLRNCAGHARGVRTSSSRRARR